ncbi:MAG: succinylglutamate desuccinylase/aspartoacylase family protein, partial [Alphaproteobacteria bacterium]|nr:succinylglutamate desuccinylase/aspartoacylase family protein [Alphaproteobacteria bacterium]
MIEKFVFDSGKSGVHLLVLGGIHGNEIAGIYACQKIIADLQSRRVQLKSGCLTLVPICNPQAYRQDIRQIDENLNRVIKQHSHPITYEQKCANEIAPLIRKNDFTLDLHSTHCIGDVPFAFCDYPKEYNQLFIQSLNVDYVLTGWPSIYADKDDISDCSTEQYAHICGQSATTVECGYHKEPQAIELAYQAILNALRVFDMIEQLPNDVQIVDIQSTKKKTIIRLKEYIVKEKSGRLCQNYKHLDNIHK